MEAEQFETLLIKRLDQIQNTLGHKAKEYVQEGDRLYNFKVAARVNNTTSAKALWGMITKHLVSVMDLKDGKLKATHAMINEKIGDMINYLILLEAILKEDLNEEDNPLS